MKTLNKIIIVLITISFLTSCSNKPKEERRSEYLYSKLDIVNYDGHNYIIYSNSSGYAGMGGICHSESCPCKTIN